MARRRRRNPANIGCIAVVLILALAIIIGVPMLVDSLEVEYYDTLTVEAGSVVEAKDFLPESEKAERKKAEFVTDINAISMVQLGDYPVQIRVGDKTFTSQLVIEDTVAPVAKGKDVTLYNPSNLKAEDLVEGLQDATEVKATVTPELDVNVSTAQQVTRPRCNAM